MVQALEPSMSVLVGKEAEVQEEEAQIQQEVAAVLVEVCVEGVEVYHDGFFVSFLISPLGFTIFGKASLVIPPFIPLISQIQLLLTSHSSSSTFIVEYVVEIP
jgi:hypothetical protein